MDEGSEFSLSIPVKAVPEVPQVENDQNLVEIIREDVEEIQNILDEKQTQEKEFVNTLQIPENVDDDRNIIQEGDKTILIIEDDTNFAKALLKYAHLQNYKAVIEVRGDRGLAAALEYRPQAILLDVSASRKRRMAGDG